MMRMNKIYDSLKAIKDLPKEKIEEIRNQAEGESRMKVVLMIMEEEGWTYEQTIQACTGPDGVRVPRYSLYWKLSEPSVVLALRSKKSKKKFAETLPEDEREIFLAEQDQFNVGKEMRRAIKDKLAGRA